MSKVIDYIYSISEKDKRVAWKRKHDKIQEYLVLVEQVEDKILDIIVKEKQPLMDKISELRSDMVQNCTHPKQYLVVYDDYVECKFCNTKIAVPSKYYD
jgi:hypothetical protein